MQNIHGLGPRGHDVYSEDELARAPFSWIEDEAIWQFLYCKIRIPETGRIGKAICDTKSVSTWESFRGVSGSKRPVWKLKDHFQDELAPNLNDAFLAGDSKIELYFGLGLPLPMDFYSHILREGELELDSFGRINRFEQKNGMLLESINYRLIRPKSQTEDEAMWAFLCGRIYNPDTEELIHPSAMPAELEVWKEYKDKFKPRHSVHTLHKMYRDGMVSRLHNTHLDLTMKAKLCFVLRIPVHVELMEDLEKIATVRLNDYRRITYYYENKSNLELVHDENSETNGKNQWRRMAFTEEEETEMYKFVYHKLLDARTNRIKRDKALICSRELWAEFDKGNRVHRDAHTYMRRFKSTMLPVCYLAKISNMMKMSLHFALEIPVHEDLLKDLRQDAIIELNKEGCIIAYRERQKRVYSNVRTTTENSDDIIDLENEEPASKLAKSDESPEIIFESDWLSVFPDSPENVEFNYDPNVEGTNRNDPENTDVFDAPGAQEHNFFLIDSPVSSEDHHKNHRENHQENEEYEAKMTLESILTALDDLEISEKQIHVDTGKSTENEPIDGSEASEILLHDQKISDFSEELSLEAILEVEEIPSSDSLLDVQTAPESSEFSEILKIDEGFPESTTEIQMESPKFIYEEQVHMEIEESAPDAPRTPESFEAPEIPRIHVEPSESATEFHMETPKLIDDQQVHMETNESAPDAPRDPESSPNPSEIHVESEKSTSEDPEIHVEVQYSIAEEHNYAKSDLLPPDSDAPSSSGPSENHVTTVALPNINCTVRSDVMAPFNITAWITKAVDDIIQKKETKK